MPKSHDDVMAELPPERRARIEARARELLAMEAEAAVTPFDGLAEHAIEEYRQERTISLQAYADKHNIDLTGEAPLPDRKIPRSAE